MQLTAAPTLVGFFFAIFCPLRCADRVLVQDSLYDSCPESGQRFVEHCRRSFWQPLYRALSTSDRSL